MSRNRITMLGLMASVAIVGLLLAVMRHPTAILGCLAWTGVLTVLMGAALVAVLDPRRTFWVGFGLVGLLYVFLGGHELSGDDGDRPLLTTYLLDAAYEKLARFDHVGSIDRDIPWHIVDSSARDSYTREIAFHRAGQSLAAFLHALAGGMVAVLIRERLLRHEPVPRKVSTTPGPEGVTRLDES